MSETPSPEDESESRDLSPNPPTAHTVTLRPVAPGERIDTIDILRGLALFGILAANIRGFAGPALTYFTPDRFWPVFHDRLAQGFIDTLIQGKFITIFGFLFGTGFAIQLSRAEERGARFGRTYARRLFILAIFGLIHGVLIWFGDILLVYALVGFLLLFFRKRSDKTVLIWGLVAYFMPLILMTVFVVVTSITGQMPPGPPEPTLAQIETQRALFTNGSWSAIHEQRMSDVVKFNWGFSPIYGMHVLGLFLFGVLAWRRRLYQPDRDSLPRYRQVMIWGLVIGLAGNTAATVLARLFEIKQFPPTPLALFIGLIQNLTIPALSSGYICAVILLCQSEFWKAALRPFGAIGRTALTNYLLQSVIGTLLFYSYGLGLFGMGPALLLIPTFAIYAAQAVISPWWLTRYRFGPVEWLWRSLTYGAQPMATNTTAVVEEPTH